MDNQASKFKEPRATPHWEHNGPPRIRSSRLLGVRGELIIEHEGREYRLRLTQNRKLILTA